VSSIDSIAAREILTRQVGFFELLHLSLWDCVGSAAFAWSFRDDAD